MSDKITLELNSPITEEQWDIISDVDFDHTDEITFYTKHGKEVTFVKSDGGGWTNQPERKKGKWIQKEKCYPEIEKQMDYRYECSECGFSDIHNATLKVPFCWHCGAAMRGDT